MNRFLPCNKRVTLEVFAALDVILIFICPIQLNLLAIVRNGVSVIALVATLGDEVTTFVVAGEEGHKTTIHVVLQLCKWTETLHLFAKFHDRSRSLCLLSWESHSFKSSQLGIQLCFQGKLVTAYVLSKNLIHLIQQTILQEVLDLITLVVHDAIDAKVELLVIHHKDVLKSLNKSVILINIVCHYFVIIIFVRLKWIYSLFWEYCHNVEKYYMLRNRSILKFYWYNFISFAWCLVTNICRNGYYALWHIMKDQFFVCKD